MSAVPVLTLEGGHVAALFLVLLRCTGFVLAAPLLGYRSMPAPVKAGLAAVLAVTLLRGASVSAGPLPVLLAAPLEIVIGLALGFIVELGFRAVELTGRLVALQMGLSLGAVFDPLSHEPTTAFDPFFGLFAGLLFLALDLHLAMVGALARSFEALPLGGAWPADLMLLAANLTALTIEMGARLAMPLALVLLLAELAVALVARAIPQVNVFFLGLPLKILLALAVTAAAVPGLAAGAAAIQRFVIGATVTGAHP